MTWLSKAEVTMTSRYEAVTAPLALLNSVYQTYGGLVALLKDIGIVRNYFYDQATMIVKCPPSFQRAIQEHLSR